MQYMGWLLQQNMEVGTEDDEDGDDEGYKVNKTTASRFSDVQHMYGCGGQGGNDEGEQYDNEDDEDEEHAIYLINL